MCNVDVHYDRTVTTICTHKSKYRLFNGEKVS